MTSQRTTAMNSRSGNLTHALRVAAVAAVVIAVLYVAVVGVLDQLVSHRLIGQVDARLSDRLQDASAVTRTPAASKPQPSAPPGTAAPDVVAPAIDGGDADVDAAPVFLWRVRQDGSIVAAESGAPTLPSGAWSRSGGSRTARLGASEFRLRSTRVGDQWLVAGVSLADPIHVRDLLLIGEAVVGPLVVLGTFFASLVIGLQASAPVEQARRRQLEFTADASHELRTPLSVIEAEVALALRRARTPTEYRQALARVGEEGSRLRRIVEDLLWLARFDSTPPPPAQGPVDLGAVAGECADRFEPLAAARGLSLSILRQGAQPWVSAPSEWMERLVGVLLDNGCRYTPAGGMVRVSVEGRGGRSTLAVDDSGPGIAEEDRARLFDRFHRMSDLPGGTGLGLAIADSVVRSTGGRWNVGRSELGGARFEITWHRPHREHTQSEGAGLSVDETSGRAQPLGDQRDQGEPEGDPAGHTGHQGPLAKPGSGHG